MDRDLELSRESSGPRPGAQASSQNTEPMENETHQWYAPSVEQFARLSEAVSALLRSHAKLEPTRQSALLHRDELNYATETSLFKREFCRQSRISFIRGSLDPITSSKASGARLKKPKIASKKAQETANSVSSLALQLEEDERALEDQEEKVRHLQQRLSQLEFSMQIKERKFVDDAAEIMGTLQEIGLHQPSNPDASATHSATEWSLTSRESSPKRPAVLDSYYEKVGDVKVMRERLMDIEMEFRDEQTLRTLRQDQELALEVPEAQFQADFEDRHAKANADYNDALTAKHLARQDCMDHGVDPDSHLDIFECLEPNLSTLKSSSGALVYPSSEQGPITPPERLAAPPGFGYLSSPARSLTMLSAPTGNIDDEPDTGLVSLEDDLEHRNRLVERWMETNDVQGGINLPEETQGLETQQFDRQERLSSNEIVAARATTPRETRQECGTHDNDRARVRCRDAQTTSALPARAPPPAEPPP